MSVGRSAERVRTRRRWPAAAVAVLLALAVLALPGQPAGAATATVGNGLTTTDLNAVGMSPGGLAAALVGPGVTVSNVTYSGDNAQAGLIHVVDPAVVSFNDGVIMSSGSIADVVGPNKSDGITGDMAGPADADLNALIAETQTVYPMTFDRAVLEFDFVPAASDVYFTYTFGSDEYLEWVNLFNDVFAFFVNGQNCATVPGDQPVSIDTINSAVNPQLFRDNSYSSPPANPINIESDGLSVEMICHATVQAGQVNHMKLAIADTSDQILDSVVMLKSHSLTVTPPESCNDGVDNDDDLLVDVEDDSCSGTTTPPPPGSEGIGSDGSAPPFTGNEGTPIPLDASALGWTAAAEAISTAWTVTGINGTPGTCEVTPAGPTPLEPDGSIAVAHAVCPNEGEYVARVEGWDVEGGSAFDDDVDFFVHNAPPAVSLDAPANGSQVTLGGALDLAATVTDPGAADAVTCEISWGDGAVEPGTFAAGTCSGTHTYSSPGPVLLSVTATDDAGDSSAAAAMIDVVASATTLTSSANPSVKGQPVVLTATTTAGTTGSMSFYDGATLLGKRTVSAGSASLTTAALAAGDHQITASYAATTTATPSVSAPMVQHVDPASTTTAVSSSLSPSVVGQAVSLWADVAVVAPGAGTPTGPVEFYDGTTLVGTRNLSKGRATLSVKPTVGSHDYSAVYVGSANYLGSASAVPFTQQVDPASTTVTLTSTVATTVFGQAAVVKATVRAVTPGGGYPTGTVDLYEGATLLATKVTTNAGAASFTLRPSVGTHEYTAVYGGSPSYVGSSTATPLAHQVVRAATTTVLSSSLNPVAVGKSVTLRATVRAVAPGAGVATGTATFFDGGVLLGTAPLVSGRAALATKTLAAGDHSITAVYDGDGNFTGSDAVPFVQTVV